MDGVNFFVEKNIFEVKHDVIGSKRGAVRPSDTFHQMKGKGAACFVGLPFFGQIGDNLEIRTPSDQWIIKDTPKPHQIGKPV